MIKDAVSHGRHLSFCHDGRDKYGEQQPAHHSVDLRRHRSEGWCIRRFEVRRSFNLTPRSWQCEGILRERSSVHGSTT